MRKIIMNSKIKILIGVLIVGIILISGWWIWSKPPSENGLVEEINGRGETIEFRIDDTIQICTNELPYRIVNPNINKPYGKVIMLKHSCGGFAGYGIDQYCENGKIRTEKVGGCSDVILCENKTIHETFIWDQKEYVEITEECEGKTIHREVKKQVPEGKYQIIVNGKVIKEFTIK